jgi:hypothetical protein
MSKCDLKLAGCEKRFALKSLIRDSPPSVPRRYCDRKKQNLDLDKHVIQKCSRLTDRAYHTGNA